MELTAEQKEVCRRAVEKFGRRHQTLKVAAELHELAHELEVAAISGYGSGERIIDERADVAMMLYQLDELIMPKVMACVQAHIQVKVDKLRSYVEGEV